MTFPDFSRILRTLQTLRAVRTPVLVLAGLWLSALSAHASEGDSLGELPVVQTLRFNGFATLGVTHSRSEEPWSFSRDLTTVYNPDPTRGLIDSRIGGQLNWRLAPSTELVGQAVLKKSGEPTLDDRIEWAFLSHDLSPAVNVRLGRINPDIFLLADHRSVGVAYPWVRPAVAFYGWMPLQSIDGGDASVRWQGAGLDWRVRAAVGQGQAKLSMWKGPTLTVKTRSTGALTLTSETDQLTLKASLAQAHFSLDGTGAPEFVALDQALVALQSLPIPTVAAQAAALRAGIDYRDCLVRYAALGVLYDAAPWLLHAEIGRTSGTPVAFQGTQAYGSVGYRHGHVTWYGLASVRRPKVDPMPLPTAWATQLTPLLGPQLAADATAAGVGAAVSYNSGRFDIRSNGLGLRWDVTPSAALKLQWERYSVPSETRDARLHPSVWSAVLDVMF